VSFKRRRGHENGVGDLPASALYQYGAERVRRIDVVELAGLVREQMRIGEMQYWTDRMASHIIGRVVGGYRKPQSALALRNMPGIRTRFSSKMQPAAVRVGQWRT
jgi:hypothetical protein